MGQGELLWAQADSADHFILPICGTVRCESERLRQSFRQGVGSAVGITDVLARQPRRYRATADSPLIALTFGRDALIDAFEDDLDMGTRAMASMARDLLSLLEKRAEISAELPSGVSMASDVV